MAQARQWAVGGGRGVTMKFIKLSQSGKLPHTQTDRQGAHTGCSTVRVINNALESLTPSLPISLLPLAVDLPPNEAPSQCIQKTQRG